MIGPDPKHEERKQKHMQLHNASIQICQENSEQQWCEWQSCKKKDTAACLLKIMVTNQRTDETKLSDLLNKTWCCIWTLSHLWNMVVVVSWFGPVSL